MKLSNRNKVRKEERRVSAAERKSFHASLTTEQKLLALDARLGKGAGAVKERKRLLEQGPMKPVSKETAEAVFGVAETKKELVKKKGQKRNGRDPRTAQEQPKT